MSVSDITRALLDDREKEVLYLNNAQFKHGVDTLARMAPRLVGLMVDDAKAYESRRQEALLLGTFGDEDF